MRPSLREDNRKKIEVMSLPKALWQMDQAWCMLASVHRYLTGEGVNNVKI